MIRHRRCDPREQTRFSCPCGATDEARASADDAGARLDQREHYGLTTPRYEREVA